MFAVANSSVMTAESRMQYDVMISNMLVEHPTTYVIKIYKNVDVMSVHVLIYET